MSELERLRDRVAELEDALGLTAAIPHEIVPREMRGVNRIGTPGVRRFIGILLTRPFGSREGIYTAFYGGLPENDQPNAKTLDVYAAAARKVLKEHGVEFETIRGEGWRFDAANKAKLRAIIERLINERQQAA